MALFVNLYKNLNRDADAQQRGANRAFLRHFRSANNIFFICGDFNLHCSFWDENCADNPQMAWDLIHQLTDKGISLINDDSVPTFYRGTNVMTLGHNTSHDLSRRVISFLSFFSTWLHHRSTDGIATDTSSLCFLPVLLFLLLWSLCYSPTKPQYINRYDMFVVL